MKLGVGYSFLNSELERPTYDNDNAQWYVDEGNSLTRDKCMLK